MYIAINFKDAAVEIGAAYIDKNGNLVFKSLSDACDISELTYRGYKQLIKQINTSTGLILGELQIVPFSDKILNHYSELDNLFQKVGGLDYVPNIDFVDKRYDLSEKCYKRKRPEPYSPDDFISHAKEVAVYLAAEAADKSEFATMILSFLNNNGQQQTKVILYLLV